MRRVIWLQTPKVFWLQVEEPFLSTIERTWLNNVRQTEINAAMPLVPELSAFEIETANEKLKRHKSPGIDQIPPELIKAAGRIICSEIHKIINSIQNKEEL